jgi:SAM-dependent methyltransferase
LEGCDSFVLPPWTVVVFAVVLFALLLYWLLQVTEGAYLGSAVVTKLYDWTASRYDMIKGFSNPEESWFLSRPLLNRLAAVPHPLILDVASGTGRLPCALFREAGFRGRVVAVDFSRRMLEEAVLKTERDADHIAFFHQDATVLPFPDASFDAVTCLEALEFLPSLRQTLEEMTRVLKPGGVLLTTNRRGWESRLFPGRALTRHQMISLLERLGLKGSTIQSWQVIYDLVWARKPGDLIGDESRKIVGESDIQHRGQHISPTSVLCPCCRDVVLGTEDSVMYCPKCQTSYPIEGHIVLLANPRRAKASI